MANEFVIKNGYISKGNSQLSGSLDVSGSVSASLGVNTVGFYGTASWAVSASWAPGATPTAPGGLNTQIQFNSASAFSGSSNLSFNYTNNNLLLTGSLYLGSASQESNIYGVDRIFFNTIDHTAALAGELTWNTGDGVLEFGLSGSSGNIPSLRIGEQNIGRIYNSQGTTLTKGQVVYISGSQGNRIAVKLASATNEYGSAGTLGFVLENIPNGQEGYVLTEGPLYNLNTTGLTAGQLIYLSSSAGQYTQTSPQAPLHSVRLGYVERVHPTVGSIYVKIDNGYELDELHNVLISSPSSSGDLLMLSGSLWINSKNLTGSYTLTGSLTTNDGVSVQSLTASFVSASSITGSLFGTASWATDAVTSYTPISVTGSSIYSTNPSTGNTSGVSGIFLGSSAGGGAIKADYTVALGYFAGQNATSASETIIIGPLAGLNATKADHSVFIGTGAGRNAVSASYSTIIGAYAGWAPSPLTGVGTNNIIIGNYVTLPDNTKNSINIGAIIFATGSYSTLGNVYSGSVMGKVGINLSNPQYNFDVSGSGNYTNGLTVTGSLIATSFTGSLFGTASWAQSSSQALTASYIDGGFY